MYFNLSISKITVSKFFVFISKYLLLSHWSIPSQRTLVSSIRRVYLVILSLRHQWLSITSPVRYIWDQNMTYSIKMTSFLGWDVCSRDFVLVSMRTLLLGLPLFIPNLKKCCLLRKFKLARCFLSIHFMLSVNSVDCDCNCGQIILGLC